MIDAKCDDCCTWEYIKAKVVKKCKEISKKKAAERNKDFKELQNAIEKTAAKIVKCQTQPEKDAMHDRLNEYKDQMTKMIAYKSNGARIRCKEKYYESGEVSSKYFISLEKVKQSNKTIKMIRCDDNTITRNGKKIINEQAKYYRKLYSKRPEIKFLLENDTEVKYTEEGKTKLDDPFSFEEFTSAVKQMAANKSPGNDGLSKEFYVMFWSKIGNALWNAMLHAHARGFLYKSALSGTISLIPKKAKDPLLLKSWRPLMILNVDLKILLKMITERLKPVLHKVIGEQQTGYVPGRFIGSNLRKLVDMLMYVEREEISAALLILDFEKCFDSIEHASMFKALEYFNIGPYFMSWVKLIYEGFEFCVVNNGYHSMYYKQSRGTHQGSALSGPLFLHVAEILAIRIKTNALIKGISVNGSEPETIAQYADDANIWSLYQEESINMIISELDKFADNTGLKVNYEKSMIYPVGAARKNAKRLKLTKNFKWADGVIESLGLLIDTNNLEDQVMLNYDSVVNKAKNVMNVWKTRGMSTLGKIEIVNTLVGSLFVYKMQVLPKLSDNVIAKINELIADFIWNARKPKIRNSVLSLDKCDGGRKLVNLKLRDATVKIEWIRRLIQENDEIMQRLAYYHLNTEIANTIFWECNLSNEDIEYFKIQNPFWKHTLSLWATYHFYVPEHIDEISNQIIWYNSHVKVNNKVIFWKEWYDRGIVQIKDLIIENKVMTARELEFVYGLRIDTMKYNSLISAIPRRWKKVINRSQSDVNTLEFCSKISSMSEINKWAKIVYADLNKNDETVKSKAQYWTHKIHADVDVSEIQNAFKNINKYVSVVKYRSFQYRLLHGVVFLNDRLVHYGISSTNLCTFCNRSKETVEHLFIECSVTKQVWDQIQEYLLHSYHSDMERTTKRIILNQTCSMTGNESSLVDLMIVITKQKIFAAKCCNEKPNAKIIINEFEFIHELEKKIAVKKGAIKNYNLKWPDQIHVQKEQQEYEMQYLQHIDNHAKPK